MSTIQTLTPIRHLFATTRTLLDLAEKLNEADYFATNGYSADGIHGTLSHLVLVANVWRTALETGKQGVTFDRKALTSPAAVRAQLELEETAWLNLVGSLSDENVAASRTLVNYKGESVTFYTWHILLQVAMHGMQHHSELAKMLTEKGHSPGNIDILFFTP